MYVPPKRAASLTCLLFVLACALPVSGKANAQCASIGQGSNCPGAIQLSCSGSTALGGLLTVSSGILNGVTFYAIGTALPKPIPLPGNQFVCCPKGGKLFVHPDMVVGVSGSTIFLPIPNDPSLKGKKFCVQGFLGKSPFPCFRSTNAVCFTIH